MEADFPELWGGAECTIVRLGDRWRSQLDETGHYQRDEDVERIAALGLRTFRFPLLWELIAPEGNDRCDWSWADRRLERLRAEGVNIIAGLVHHGSGPHHTNLLDPDFPAKLADFAARAADRYPWIQAWTPVNEPLTTARFAGLYGHWYPHQRNVPAFMTALVNQCAAVVESMRAIRRTIPGAALVQTEDLGKTFSTAPLQYQARHDNQRRWLSLDLLTKRVDARHPLFWMFRCAGIGEAELELFQSGDGVPDLIGINHYLTSERFLDHRLAFYPGEPAGGNGRDSYVDVEAVRVKRLDRDIGIGPRLREAWTRYRRPMAITEAHHGCHRDEQLRWLAEVWDQATRLRAAGVDVRAVTLWSLFGNVDWRSLLTRQDGSYDAGAFDIRSPAPRPTIIAKAARAWAKGEEFDHPALDMPGWWRRPARLYPWNAIRPCSPQGRRILITGATGTLGRAFARICEGRGLAFRLTRRDELDLADPGRIAAMIEEVRPWAVINTAGFVRVAEAEQEQAACMAANADGAAALGEACAAAEVPLVTFSTDLVFDGRKGRPYLESDPVCPLTIYGRSKAEAEERVRSVHPGALIIRTAAFFGPWDPHNFAWHVLQALNRGERLEAPSNVSVSPTYVPDLCHVALDLLIDGEQGIWHLANPGQTSWHGWARAIASQAGLDPDLVVRRDDPESRSTALASQRGTLLRPFGAALRDWIGEVAQPELRVAAE